MIIDYKEHVLRAIQANIRFDGRKTSDYRPISIEYDISATAEGSAKVTIGNTIVLAGVKLSTVEPYADTPDEGVLMVDAQLLPISSPHYEQGPPDIDAIELARVIDRGIRESKCVDNSKLCIKKGEKVWSVCVDICTLNVDGNVFDAAALAAIAALQVTKFPKLDDEYVVDYKSKTSKSVPLVKIPIAVTVWKVGSQYLVDPLGSEERVLDTRLTVTTTESGDICSVQKGGSGTLTFDDVKAMVALAGDCAKQLRLSLK
jgi:exosome complex component RRP42